MLANLLPATVAARSTLFFGADDGAHGAELWRTNGSAASTHEVKDVLPGAHGSLPAPLTPVAGMLFFDAEDVYASMDSERELWRSDGTRWETRMVAETG